MCLLPRKLPCCFFLALSQIAGLKWTLSPFESVHLKEHTSTPRQLFFKMCTLWLLVFLMAHPDECLLASSLSALYTSRQCPSAHSEKGSYSLILGMALSFMSQSVEVEYARHVMPGEEGVCLQQKINP